MDETGANVHTETNQTDTGAEQQIVEVTPEKVSSLQKFIEGLFGKKPDEEVGGEEKKETEEKTFSETDMNAAIENAKQKWLEEQSEAARMGKLSPEEKAKEEQQKKDTELESLKGQLLQRELKGQAVRSLDQEGFPVKLAEMLDYSGKESMEKSLASTMELFRDSLKMAIETRLKGKTPGGLGGAASAENMIKDQIAKNIRGGMM